MKVRVLDTVSSDPCPKCGTKGWIVDGDSLHDKNAYLSCLDHNIVGCVETKPLDKDMELVIDE